MSQYDDMSWQEVLFWSFNLLLHEKSHKRLITLVCWYVVSYKYMWICTSRNIGQISYILCQLLVCSGKSQLSNYANANQLKISIWTRLMSYHVKTTLCHDIMTYDISWQPYILLVAALVSMYVAYWKLLGIFVKLITLEITWYFC